MRNEDKLVLSLAQAMESLQGKKVCEANLGNKVNVRKEVS